MVDTGAKKEICLVYYKLQARVVNCIPVIENCPIYLKASLYLGLHQKCKASRGPGAS